MRQVREMLRDHAGIGLAADIDATLAEDLCLRSARIAAQIEAVEEARHFVVARMTDRVTDALSMLGRASALSELPEGIGAWPWDHKRSLTLHRRLAPRMSRSRCASATWSTGWSTVGRQNTSWQSWSGWPPK